MPAIKTQSKDPVIQDAARQGVKIYKWSGGYSTASAKDCARQAHVSESYMRKLVWILNAGDGLMGRVDRGELTEDEALPLAKVILTGGAEIGTKCGNQRRTVNDDLAEATAEIRRLRSILQDLGVSPDS